MKCKICKAEAVVALRSHNAAFCPDCYKDFFARQVARGIEGQKLFTRDERILVALSGGKDSLALMLELSRHTIPAHRDVTVNQKWDKYAFVGRELRGKTLGVLGFGRIGQRVGEIARVFGMKVVAYDPYLPAEIFTKNEATSMSIAEVCEVADFVTIHMPLNDETRNLFNATSIAEMKSDAVVLNMARGGIVNEADLCAALRAGTIAGAGTDVFCNEPPKPDDPLLNTPNLIVSPHSAAQTREAVIKMANMCVDGCLAVIRGEKWPFVADKKVYDHPKWADK